jgi:Tol biopolymer transport system component
MSVRSAVRRRRRRALFLALPVLAGVLAPTAAQASWPGLNGWQSFSSNRFDTAISGDIFVMPPIALPQVQLTTARPDDAQSAWSPDGRRIAFKSRRNNNNELYVMNPDGSAQTRLTNSSRVSEGQPAWSRDGTRLLYRQTPDNPVTQNADIWQIDVDPAAPHARPVLERTGDERYPSYSPDGTKILFRGDLDLVDHSGDEELYVMDADGRNIAQLTHNNVFDSAPAFSPDGTRIAFESARDSGDPLALDIYVMNADGTDVRRLTADPAHDEGPIFSPDGTKIAFASLRSGQEDIWVMNADGTGLRQLTDDPARDESPDWQPVPFDMTGHTACGDVGLDRGQASSVAARNVSCTNAVAQARRWAAEAAAGAPPARLRGYACTTAPHTFDLVLVRCVKDEPEPGDPPRDVAFVWRDPAVTLPSGGAVPAA